MTVHLGLDYGTRRTGIALSDPTATIARAYGFHLEPDDGSIFKMLRAIITDHGVKVVVMGLPLTADGREADMAQKVRRFESRLAQELQLPIHLVDERFSSKEADRWLGKKRRTKGERDAVAAELILQQYLDSVSRTT